MSQRCARWSLLQSGARTLKFLFAGQNSDQFWDSAAANRWNERQNRFRHRRKPMPASHSGWSEFGTANALTKARDGPEVQQHIL